MKTQTNVKAGSQCQNNQLGLVNVGANVCIGVGK
jgi:hypothetical protein